jgi:hypothetical protein
MNRYEPNDDQTAQAPASGANKRFNIALFLPLGGMIIVGLTSLLLGLLLSTPPKRTEEPLGLPSVDEYERARLLGISRDASVPDAGPTEPDGGSTEPDGKPGE